MTVVEHSIHGQQEQFHSTGHKPVCHVPGSSVGTSTCICLITPIDRASTHFLRAFSPADIGTTTKTTSNICSTCVVLALVANCQDCQPRLNNQ